MKGFLLLTFASLVSSFLHKEDVLPESSWLDSNDPFQNHNISAPDGSIQASFIGLGATVTNLFVKDKTGEWRDVVLGYDNKSQYLHDPAYPRFGPIVGRYADRIKNSTFSIPLTRQVIYNSTNTTDVKVYHVTPTSEARTERGMTW